MGSTISTPGLHLCWAAYRDSEGLESFHKTDSSSFHNDLQKEDSSETNSSAYPVTYSEFGTFLDGSGL